MAKISLFGIFILSCLVISFYSCQSNDEGSFGEDEFDTHGQSGVVDDVSALNILQIAISSEDHSTLVAGVKAAELENVLVNPGPLTVFAPNNAAFDKLPEGTLDELLKPENKNKLANIITSHAAPGTFAGDLLKHGTKLYLATGQYVDVEVKDGDTFVNGSKLLGTVDASNGVVHVIEDVWLF
ncbi:MAG: fasciclin domain-containing protein [Ignavibacteria bacterium]|jgi:uncharacterized surface protein with fasciclin (FAS1) repeats